MDSPPFLPLRYFLKQKERTSKRRSVPYPQEVRLHDSGVRGRVNLAKWSFPQPDGNGLSDA